MAIYCGMAPDRIHWTPERKKKFLKAFEKSGNVTKAAESVKMSRRAVYALRARDADFAMHMDEAKEVAIDELEAVAHARAVGGWDEVTYELKSIEVDDPHSEEPRIITELVETKRVRRYSDTVLLRLLEAHDDRFKRGVTLEAGKKLEAGMKTLADLISAADEAEDEGSQD